MATSLTTGNAVIDASQFTTARIDPEPATLLLAFVATTRQAFTAGTVAEPAISGAGLTWSLVKSITTEDGNQRLSCLRALGPTPAAGTLTIGFGDQLQDVCAWSIIAYDAVDTTGVDGAGAIDQVLGVADTATNIGATLAAGAVGTRTVGAVLLGIGDGGTHPVSAGAGFTEIHQQTPTQFLGRGMTLQTQDSSSGARNVTWSWDSTQTAAALVVAVKPAPTPGGGTGTGPGAAATPVEALVRTYEPILHLDVAEAHVPVDAKRYLEAAALWGATPAFTDKATWVPLATAGTLAGSRYEPGSFLGTPRFLTVDETNERFLELGGWKNATEGHEAAPTASSTNAYADRAEILLRYRGDLADSRFWYHAEVFDTDRLRRLAGRVTAPALGATLAAFANPILLCYYLFYPAHEQSLDANTCPSVAAREIACHAGDWHCVAVLLDGAGDIGPENYTPKFFGITGSRPAAAADGTFRPYRFDPENRMVMKIEAWRNGSSTAPVQPDVVGTHPRFYVARGTHGMYVVAGSHEVAPFDDAQTSAGCGRFDAPGAVPPSSPGQGDVGDRHLEMVLVVKTIAGALIDAIAGAVLSSAIESGPRFKFATEPVTPAVDPPAVDTTAGGTGPGSGVTIKPAGLVVPGVGDAQDWRSQQGLQTGGRTYDYLVDRGAQIWWPGDDGTSGFRGRWGQRVATDPLSHRAGVRFPDFWRMFLLALENGFGTGALERPK